MIFLSAFLFLTVSFPTLPESSLLRKLNQPTDSTSAVNSVFHGRTITDSALVKYRADPEFDYSEIPVQGVSFSDILKRWFYEYFLKPLEETVGGSILTLLFYASIIGLFIWILLKYFRLDSFDIFKPGSSNSVQKAGGHQVNGVNVMVDFNESIQKAVLDGKFNKAVELEFLFLLAVLEKQKHILCSPDKSNYDYFNEIRNPEIKSRFIAVSNHFEYVWYGDFIIDFTIFSEIQKQFTELRTAISPSK